MNIHQKEAEKAVAKFLKEDLIHAEAKISATIMLRELIAENQAMGRLSGADEEPLIARIKSLEMTIMEVQLLAPAK